MTLEVIKMKTNSVRKTIIAGIAAVSLIAAPVQAAFAAPTFLPDVTDEMCEPSYWLERSAPAVPAAVLKEALATPSNAERAAADEWARHRPVRPSAAGNNAGAGQNGSSEENDIDLVKEAFGAGNTVLAGYDDLQDLNSLFLETDGLNMLDLTKQEETFDGVRLLQLMWKSGMTEAAPYLGGGYYDSTGEPISGPFMVDVLLNMETEELSEEQELRYGICVNRSNLRQLPSDEIITDAVGDNDFDYFQLSSLRVNEPVLVRSVSADKAWYYVDTLALSGWVHAEDIALCRDKEEWMSAWQIPEDRVLVVTGGKFFLEKSNTSAEVSGRMLTMGTVLELAEEDEIGERVTNRSVYHNHVVWLPVREEDGSYTKELALISEHQPVHEGYLPLTTENILETAFSMLGDAYGWGGMLDANDCSGYLRDIYRCFGLELPRNTTWQAAMPVYKYDTKEMSIEEKKEILDTLPAGSLLYFNGHGMMYLGKEGDKYYVISSFSSMMDADGVTRRRVRSVSVNTLDTLRANGHSWLEDIHTMTIPYLGAELIEAKPEDVERTVLVKMLREAAALKEEEQRRKRVMTGKVSLR